MSGAPRKKPEDRISEGERIQIYPKPRYARLLIAYAFNNQDTKSSTGYTIIRDFFNRMPETEIKKLLEIYHSLSEEQKRKPGKREDI